MAARWIGLSRPKQNKKRKREKMHDVHHGLRVFGIAGMLLFAAGLNFAMYPDALASVVGLEASPQGFVPAEPQLQAAAPARPFVEPDPDDVHLLAATMWGEARSEGEEGMRAVGHVIVNRIGDRFGADLETVVRAPKQFSAWNLGDPNRALVMHPERYATGGVNQATWEVAQTVAYQVLSGQSVDPTNGALFYHTRAISPYWSRYGQGRNVIGAHVFYRDVPDQPRARRYALVRTSATPARRLGPRAGRVHGVIQHAPVQDLPAPRTVSVAPSTPAAPTPLPVSFASAP
ncbi:cell wall hydrolase [Terricaulis sp.]|uniref:cell wall hydrolase n=1 Tax=Terricaulis sp. TaxID=2768686 RepID=UPI003784EE8C